MGIQIDEAPAPTMTVSSTTDEVDTQEAIQFVIH